MADLRRPLSLSRDNSLTGRYCVSLLRAIGSRHSEDDDFGLRQRALHLRAAVALLGGVQRGGLPLVSPRPRSRIRYVVHGFARRRRGDRWYDTF
ncbi:unnamed protein product [Trichogramma brassicae]|uniref:Uncharacterized protein n=1 Tax=Trichogramma brassicae TaxID=86971 RepID=A0A6H5ISH5_9HYME|nr:unnamed protein product [Trichogramma brassicae]